MGAGASANNGAFPEEFNELDAAAKKDFGKRFQAILDAGGSPEEAMKTLYRDELERRAGLDPVVGDPNVIATAVLKLAELDHASGAGTEDPESTASASPTIEGGVTLNIPLTALVETIDKVVHAGFTPLVADDSEDNKVDTFFSYRGVSILDGKKMGLDKSMKGVELSVIMEEARDRLVSALKYGNFLVVAMMQSVTDFATTFTDECEACQNDVRILVAGL